MKKNDDLKLGELVDYEGIVCRVVGRSLVEDYYYLQDEKTSVIFEVHKTSVRGDE